MINGSFTEAADAILSIGQNIYDEVWNIVSENDLIQYFTITLLVSFKRHVLKEIVYFILIHSSKYYLIP